MSEQPRPRRQSSRFLAALPARVRLGSSEHPCSAHDLSRSGVLVAGALPRPEEPELELTIETPGGDLRLAARARVVHVQPAGADGEIRIGLEFLGLDAEQGRTVESLVARVMEGMAPAALDGLGPDATDEELREAIARISRAHRIALARRAQAREREILRRDQDPVVLEALARNPGLSLREAIAMARLPHLLPTTIEILSEDLRWKRNDEMRVLLATHPRATFETVDKIIADMRDLEIQRVLRRPGLNPAMREKLMRVMARRHRGA